MIDAMLALQDLDQTTAGFFVSEMFAHGSLDMRKAALDALRVLDPGDRTSRELRELLKCNSR